MFDLLKRLCELRGISGQEDAVRSFILEQIADRAQVHVDPLGNVIVFQKGMSADKTVMLSAHMDEVGFLITHITDEGLCKFAAVGGIDDRIVVGKRVCVGEKGIPGVIGTKAVHMQTDEERGKAPKLDDLYIDIGCASKEEALLHVALGDMVTFDSDYIEFGDGRIKARALDDRIGCAVLLSLLDVKPYYDTYYIFTVQEEVGARGAKTAAFAVNPDISIVLEATTAADLPGVTGNKRVCELLGGVVIPYMDRSTVYDRALTKRAFALAQSLGIPAQTKQMFAGGNDSGSIGPSRDGVRCVALCAACRNIHSPSCVIAKEDAVQLLALTKAMLGDRLES